MHKKLEADLISLAHRILKMNGKSDVFTLQRTAKDVYEKLSLLAFVEEYVNHTPGVKESKEDLLEKVVKGLEIKAIQEKENKSEEVVEEKGIHDLEDNKTEQPDNGTKESVTLVEGKSENLETQKQEDKTQLKATAITEQPFDELEGLLFGEQETTEETPPVSETKSATLDDELQDTISVDVMADLFENAPPKSINDRFASTLQIGLNDRIAFVKHLFNGNQEDYNRVISQLNTFKSEKDANKFINTMVKPDYDWSAQEELESRFLEIVARKFA